MTDYRTEVQIVGIGDQTLVGNIEKSFPRKNGNCFSAILSEPYNGSKSRRVVNFIVENLNHLLKEGIITYPIKGIMLDGQVLVINDHRIPEEYYRNTFCEVCCPQEFLPAPQRLKHLRDIDSGVREERGGIIFYRVNAQPRKLMQGWTVENLPSLEIKNES